MCLHIADPAALERDKYNAIWEVPNYRDFSPGVSNVENFMAVMKPKPDATIIDLGCGTGAAGLEFAKRGLWPCWTDLTSIALDIQVDRERFVACPLWSCAWHHMRPSGWDYGFCVDVLEHIPTEFTMLAIDRILTRCRTAWLMIATEPDQFGALIGQKLHLTVQPIDWWLARIATMGAVTDARDLCGRSLFVVTR